jgi:TonB family protein
MPVLDQKIEAEGQVETSTPEDFQPKQRRRMLIALALLFASLIVVAARNWEFWSQYLFPPEPAVQSNSSDDSDDGSAEITMAPPAAVSSRAPVATSKTKAKLHKNVPAVTAAEDATSPAVTTSRAVLPPLQVEVVAGDHHQTVRPANNSINVELMPRSQPLAQPAPVANQNASQATIVASDRVRISPSAAEVISRPVRPNYPLLARQMKVEGAVVLQALIGKEGTIQDLQVISGPAILSAAARQAVTQWHFKPYLQDGQPVETEARITVNFTISTN